MSVEIFGHLPGGEAVHRLRLSGGGLSMHLLTFGAVVQDLRLAGHAAPLVLGFDRLEPYLTHQVYFGCTVGRYANRIAEGRCRIDGRDLTLERNERGRTHLHGGSAGAARKIWRLEEHGTDMARLSLTLPDGEMGYPGNLRIAASFRLLPGGLLDILYEAETDAPTLCNLAHHSYFALGDLLTVRMRIDAETYLPVDAWNIPTDGPAPVAGTPYDFRAGREIGAGGPPRIDHNFCLSQARVPIRPVAWLTAPSGLSLEVRTTEPGLQVYDAHGMDLPLAGLDGQSLGPYAGIALEPQVWPDSPNHPDFPQALLRPGESYRQHTQYAFTRGPT